MANLVIGLLVGMNVKPYRPSHFNHHRQIGTPADTEISYFDALNISFIARALLGIKVLDAVTNRNKVYATPEDDADESSTSGRAASLAVACSVLLHLTLTLAAAWFGWYGTAASWAVGVFVFYPFWGALRTLLEHRDEMADSKVDYRVVSHGAVTRRFRPGPISNTFGMAGFRLHQLHHWDPAISYTRLDDVERFLPQSSDGRQFLESRPATTYPRTFARLYDS